MKRKCNAAIADHGNPVWTKATFARSPRARDLSPEILGSSTAARMLKPRGRPQTGNARASISL